MKRYSPIPRQSLVLGLYLCISGLFTTALRAEVTLPAVFGDHMVLQQGMTLPVWGFAAPGESVSVSYEGRDAETHADANGRWRVTLRPVPASFAPGSLVINGSNRIEIHDVIVGDVWICAGEGNMELPLADSIEAGESPASSDRALRFFTAGRDASAHPAPSMSLSRGKRGSGSWAVCTPESASAFSAVGYFFARDLRASRHVPVGMVNCSWEGTPIISWISLQGLGRFPSVTAALASYARSLPLFEQTKSAPSILPANSESLNERKKTPSSLFNGMIAPIIPYAMTGVIWCQGESDEATAALEYRRLLPRLIRDWRSHWGEGPFPFYFATVAGFGSAEGPPVEPYFGPEGKPGRALPWLRDSAASALALPGTGMAVTTDLGLQDERYPADKLNVGRRLALLARYRHYGEELIDSGPRYRGMSVEGNKVRVEFDSVGGGLTLAVSPSRTEMTSPLTTSLRGFALAGSDGKWFPAKGRIDGSSVRLSSDAVLHPAAVRYNWKGYPTGNLYNKEGLPAGSFRSDTDQPQ